MSTAITQFEKLSAALLKIDGVSNSQMFGKTCLKVNGKAFIAQHKEWLVFKLTGPVHAKAMAIQGACLWDPSGKGRAMKEWVALPGSENKNFPAFAKAALAYVAENP
jgi:hypothetical protein